MINATLIILIIYAFPDSFGTQNFFVKIIAHSNLKTLIPYVSKYIRPLLLRMRFESPVANV